MPPHPPRGLPSMTEWAILEAPSSLGLRASGVRRLPKALLDAGLAEGLGDARPAGRLEPPDDGGPEIDPDTGVLHAAAIAAYSRTLAAAVGGLLDRGETPVVLGGDCSILLGNLLALRARGRYGLLFVDGHADFYDPVSEPTGEAASMDLALATGRGPGPLVQLDGTGPLVRDEDVAVIGRRDHDVALEEGSPPLPATISALDLPVVRERGVAAVAETALRVVARTELDGFWLHLDADVLDDAIVPAVDYRLPGGLHWAELETLLRAATASRRLTGVEVTILNPELDPTGDATRGLADCLVAGLR
jgi:arginase